MFSKIYYLIGLPGSGKTHFGKLISEKITCHFADLDADIQERIGLSVDTIFQNKGEYYFRKLESKILREYVKYGRAILATGGGTPCFFNNMQWMNATGKTIFLNQDIQTIINHINLDKNNIRPLLKNINPENFAEFLSLLLKERSPYYQLAHSNLTPAEINLENIENIILSH